MPFRLFLIHCSKKSIHLKLKFMSYSQQISWCFLLFSCVFVLRSMTIQIHVYWILMTTCEHLSCNLSIDCLCF